MNPPRLPRLERLIQEQIGSLIIEGKIKDPRVDTFLSVTHVTVSRDLSFADVYVSSYKTSEGLAKGAAGLQSAAGFIQAKMNERLHLRQTPRLRFHADSGLREAFTLNQKLDEIIQHDRENHGETAPEGGVSGAK